MADGPDHSAASPGIKLPGLPRLTARKQSGDRAETLALAYLQRQGLKPVASNYHCRGGEIDLVMRHGDHLVFIEVRYRAGRAFGGAAASITPAKQRKVIVAAQHYLLSLTTIPPCRFDVIAIDGNDQVQWIRDAFGVDG